MKRHATLFDTGNSRTLKSGLGIMLAVVGLGVLSSAPAQAHLLNGHVEAVDIDNASDDTTKGANSNPGSNLPSVTTGGALPWNGTYQTPSTGSAAPTSVKVSGPTVTNLQNPGTPAVAYARPPVGAAQAPVMANSLPRGFSGRWQCATKVVDSAVDTVAVGSELLSAVDFAELKDGRVAARWLQPGWTETQATALSWTAREAQVDRTSYYFGEGMNGAWASRSRDHFVQVSPDRLECKSYIDQYMDGRYLGRYRTVSVLTRIGTVNSIALTNAVEKR